MKDKYLLVMNIDYTEPSGLNEKYPICEVFSEQEAECIANEFNNALESMIKPNMLVTYQLVTNRSK